MKGPIPFLFSLIFIFFTEVESTSLQLQPRAFGSFNVSYIQNLRSCSYTVVITTSCSSSKYTRDQISLAFGDAYGNQIYSPRLDDPGTRTFERCSSDTFQITGPCAYQICYVYLYRSGPDGWKPESVKIYGYNSRAVTFIYNAYIPDDIWYGFNLCQSASTSNHQSVSRWFVYVILGFAITFLL
ncbi:embryo-specific protein ATS3B [Mangifera indica]|uniref:embryo-specific protein ATS3B n=1 Tax=Mangifera indica TaxID=29780 RepID=UPI001CFC00F7|nr:embryo-specific protein ATS3B [Mangifera indica]